MKDPQDLVLEAALRELHGAHDDAPDLAERIGAAWRRGERGSGVEGLALPGPQAGELTSPEESRPLSRIARRGWLVAAAAAALIASTLIVRALTPPTSGQPGADSVPLAAPIASAGDSAPDGARMLVHDERPFDIELPHGGRVVGQSALLAIETGRVQLELGSLTLAAPPEMPLMLSSAAGSIIFAPGARAEVSVDLDLPLANAAWLTSLPAELRARELTEGGAAYPRWMMLELVEGSAWVVKPAGSEGSTTVLPGECHFVSEGGALSGPLDDATLTRGGELVTWLRGGDGSPWNSLPYGLDEDDGSVRWAAALAAFLDQHPHYWPALRASLRASFAARGENLNGCARTVRFLVSQPTEPALALARELWLLAPELFSSQHLVELAERDAFEFERETRAIVDFEPYGDPSAHVLPAAYLALQGNPRGRALLEDFLGLPITHQSNVFATLIAARCLAIAGGGDAWTSTRAAVVRESEAEWKRGWRGQAALHAAAIEFFDSRWIELDEHQLGPTLRELADHCRKRVKELDEAGALEALLAKLRNKG